MVEATGYVIELAGEAAGLVVKEGNRFRFYASAKNFSGLERTVFRSPAEAEDACRRLAFPGRATRPQMGSERFIERYIGSGSSYGRRVA